MIISVPEVISGMADCIFAFGQLLANKGLLDRSELAAAFSEAVKSGTAQQEGFGGNVESRILMASILAGVFSAPLAGEQARSRLRVVDGGAHD